MIHQFIKNGIAIVMDINSGSVHVADPLFYEAVAAAEPLTGEMEKPEPLTEDAKNAVRDRLAGRAGQEEIEEVLQNMQELIDAGELFAPAREAEELNYRGAFLHPPHGCRYTDADFDRVNAALFPNGTDGLEVYRWTTDWSDYFDDGHEWWGTLCLTVYDKSTGRFAVLLASATD